VSVASRCSVLFCAVLCVYFCTSRLVMVHSNVTCLHCLQNSFFEHHFNLYYNDNITNTIAYIQDKYTNNTIIVCLNASCDCKKFNCCVVYFYFSLHFMNCTLACTTESSIFNMFCPFIGLIHQRKLISDSVS